MLHTDTPQNRWLLRLALIGLTLIAHGAVCTHAFINFDDPLTISGNARLKPPSASNALYYWSHRGLELYIPCTYTVWSLTAAVSGAWHGSDYVLLPWGFHLANLACHLFSVLVIFEILQRLKISLYPAAIGAALFAVHPLLVESVAWATSLKDVLSGAGALTAIWQYLVAFTPATTARGANRASRRAHLVFATAAFAAAALAKPAAVATVGIVAVLDFFVVETDWRMVLLRLWPWFLIAVAIAIIARHVQPADRLVDSPLLARPLIAVDAIAFYVGKIVWPISLCPGYGRSPQVVIDQGYAAMSWAIPLVIGWFAWHFRRENRYGIVSAAVLVIGLLPTLGLIPFIFQRNSTVADRYAYLAMLGPAILLGWCAHRHKLFLRASLVLIALLTFLCIRQEAYWAGSTRLFAHAVEVSPDASINHLNYGAALADDKRFDQAAAEFRQTLALAPQDRQARENLDRLERLMAGQ